MTAIIAHLGQEAAYLALNELESGISTEGCKEWKLKLSACCDNYTTTCIFLQDMAERVLNGDSMSTACLILKQSAGNIKKSTRDLGNVSLLAG